MNDKINILLLLLCLPGFLLSCTSVNFNSSNLSENRYSDTRYVILTADDFGASENINKGIIHAVDSGVINTVSAMVTFPGAMESIRKLNVDYPDINIGLHLSITSGRPVCSPEEISSLVNDDGAFYTIDQLILRLDRIRPDELRSELSAQISEMENSGIPIDHLSSQHNILHLYSPFTRIVMELSTEHGLPMRSTMPASVTIDDFAYSKTKERGLDLAGTLVRKNPFGALGFLKYTRSEEMAANQNLMGSYGIAHPDYLIDSYWGMPTPENLHHILTHLPEGVSEICFHLGLNEDDSEVPSGIEGEYYLMRELELMSLNSREIERWLKILNIKITDFSKLQKKSAG